MSREELSGKISAGQVPADAVVWQQGMDGWKPFGEVPEFAGGGSAAAQPYATPGTDSGVQGAMPPTYLWQSIVCTLLCCLPFGIVGIVYAAKVEGLARSGDMAGAREASDKAKMWCWVSFGSALAMTVIYLFVGLTQSAL